MLQKAIPSAWRESWSCSEWYLLPYAQELETVQPCHRQKVLETEEVPVDLHIACFMVKFRHTLHLGAGAKGRVGKASEPHINAHLDLLSWASRVQTGVAYGQACYLRPHSGVGPVHCI